VMAWLPDEPSRNNHPCGAGQTFGLVGTTGA
jgi:hypothetical protein